MWVQSELKTPELSERQSGYRPEKPIQVGSPVFLWPPQPVAILRWLFGFPGYLWPWLVLFLGCALVSYQFITADTSEVRNFSARWVTSLYVENLVLLVLFVGAWHVTLYVQKVQGTEFKYSSRWLSTNNRTFLFRSQLWDNVFWNICSAVPIWSAYLAFTLWLQASGLVPTVSWLAHPVYCVFLFLLTPMWGDVHFYTTHRLIHWPPLYRSVHYLHHKNVNIGPWSGVAMHPIEHLIYFSPVILFWIIPSHPVHSVFLLQYLALAPSMAHLGFDRLRLGEKASLNTDNYWHYLHHKYVEVNYGGDLVPLDKWLGTFHDGSVAAQVAMRERVSARRLRSQGGE